VAAPSSASAAAAQTALPASSQGTVALPSSIPQLEEFPLKLDNLDGSVPRLFDDPVSSRVQAQPDGPSYYFLKPVLAAAPPQPAPEWARRAFDAEQIRRDFPILEERINGKKLVWLDNAATTQKPRAVIQRLVDYYEHEYSNVHRGAHTLAARSTDAYESAREKVQRFIGATSPEEIVFVRGTTEGVNLVAGSFGRKFIGPGDEIVLSTLEHHSNIVPWQFLAKQVGAVIRVVPVTDRGEVMLGDFERTLTTRTRFVALAQTQRTPGIACPSRSTAPTKLQPSLARGSACLCRPADRRSPVRAYWWRILCEPRVFSEARLLGARMVGQRVSASIFSNSQARDHTLIRIVRYGDL
jgi:cysteine desulfurase/selenocysteine lyase